MFAGGADRYTTSSWFTAYKKLMWNLVKDIVFAEDMASEQLIKKRTITFGAFLYDING